MGATVAFVVEPAGHSEQYVQYTPENWPAGHAQHALAFVTGMYVPRVQYVQPMAPPTE